MLIAEEFLLLVLDDGSGKRTIERDPTEQTTALIALMSATN
jgi:hypothetical protein